MLLYCCHTPAHEVLYREVFLPSVPVEFEVKSHAFDESGPGDYLSPEFLRCIRKKIDLVVRSIEENSGELIVWSDVDIRFFDLTPERLSSELEASQKDILFQRESPRMADVNTGFFVCRCSPAILDFFRTVRSELDLHPDENEQMVVNLLILSREFGIRKGKLGIPRVETGTSGCGASPGRSCEARPCRDDRSGSEGVNAEFGLGSPESEIRNPLISWGYLPRSFYARTQGWPPPRRLAIYHANYTKGADGIGQKLAQFREVEALVRGGYAYWFWSVAKRIPRKIASALWV